jgi:hypothetical protein
MIRQPRQLWEKGLYLGWEERRRPERSEGRRSDDPVDDHAYGKWWEGRVSKETKETWRLGKDSHPSFELISLQSLV